MKASDFLRYGRKETCAFCGGTGADEDFQRDLLVSPAPCEYCQGAGSVLLILSGRRRVPLRVLAGGSRMWLERVGL